MIRLSRTLDRSLFGYAPGTAGIDNLRTLDAEGMVLWRNAGTIQGDKDRAEELAKQRRGKKKVKDKG